VLLVTAFGCKGDPVKCDQACRNYAQLVFWQGADAEIAAAPADQRDALRKQKLALINERLEKEIDQCVTRCVSANNDSQNACLIEAKTADQAKACTKDE
jgi:hypothetical protein